MSYFLPPLTTWIRGENLVEVVDYIYIYIKPYTETTCLFGKCIRNSQKDCQFWTSSGFVRHQCPLGGEIFFWWDFVGLFFFFWMLRSKGLCCFGIDGCSCSTMFVRTSSLAMPRSLGLALGGNDFRPPLVTSLTTLQPNKNLPKG